MSELNPNHPTTRLVSDHWHKLCALAVQQAGGHVVISMKDLLAMEGKAITVQELADGLHLRIVSMAEGDCLVKSNGGLPS